MALPNKTTDLTVKLEPFLNPGGPWLDTGKKVTQIHHYYDPLWNYKRDIGALRPEDLALLPYFHEEYTYYAPPIFYFQNGPDPYYTQGEPVGVNGVKSTDATQLKNEAVANLFAQMRKNKAIDLMTTAAELRKTIGFIGSTAVKLARVYTELRHGQVGAALKELGIIDTHNLRGIKFPSNISYRRAKELRKRLENKSKTAHRLSKLKEFAADSWLELNYAWTPLILDVYGAAKATSDLMQETPPQVAIRGYSSKPIVGYANSYKGDIVGEQVCKGNVFARFYIASRANQTFYNLGLNDPRVTAWELVPFSFVADWFLPVGDYLKNLSALDGLVWKDGTFSLRTSCNVRNYKTIGYSTKVETYTSLVAESYNRILIDEIKPPSLSVMLQLNNSLGINNLATAFALLTKVRNY